jgi:hypothetical protein
MTSPSLGRDRRRSEHGVMPGMCFVRAGADRPVWEAIVQRLSGLVAAFVISAGGLCGSSYSQPAVMAMTERRVQTSVVRPLFNLGSFRRRHAVPRSGDWSGHRASPSEGH